MTDVSLIALLPCPFCDSPAGYKHQWAYCSNPECWLNEHGVAPSIWNARHPSAPDTGLQPSLSPTRDKNACVPEQANSEGQPSDAPATSSRDCPKCGLSARGGPHHCAPAKQPVNPYESDFGKWWVGLNVEFRHKGGDYEIAKAAWDAATEVRQREIPVVDDDLERTLWLQIGKAMAASKQLGMTGYTDEAIKSIMNIIRPYLRTQPATSAASKGEA